MDELQGSPQLDGVPEPYGPGRHRRPADVLLSRWGEATGRAAAAFILLGVTAEVIVVLLALSAPAPKPGPAAVAGGGGALFYAVHHVPLRFDVPRSLFPRPDASFLAADTVVEVSLAPLLLTGAVAGLLAHAGAALARDAQGGSLARGLHGAKVAVPYALLCFALSFALRVRLGVDRVPGPTVRPAHVSALEWPLVIGALAGFFGGILARPVGDVPPGRSDRRWTGLVAGAWQMLWLGLVLSFVGLLVVAATRPADTHAYLHGAFARGPVRGTVVVGLTTLVIPNMAAWLLSPAVGGCTGVSGAWKACVVSYGRFPAGGTRIPGPPFPSGPLHLPSAPAPYFVFLLVPLVATLVGGGTAARTAEARGRMEAAAVGAGSGLLFGALSAVAFTLSQGVVAIHGAASGFFLPGTVRVGPIVPPAFLFAAMWGLVAGAAGAMLGRVRRVSQEPPGST